MNYISISSPNSIKEKIRNMMTGQTSSVSNDVENDIEVIDHFADFSPGQIHTKTKEKIQRTSTILNGENNSPITYEYNAISYEIPVAEENIYTEIKDQVSEKLKKGNRNNYKSNNHKKASSRRVTLSKPHKQTSGSSKLAYTSASNTRNNGVTNLQISSDLEHESSPEIEILEIVPTENTNSRTSNPSTNHSNTFQVQTQTPSVGSIKISSLTESAQATQQHNISIDARMATPRSTTQKERNIPLVPIQASSNLNIPPARPGPSSAPDESPSVWDRPSPWTPKRLARNTPPKTSTSTQHFSPSSSNKRGVKRLLLDGDQENEESVSDVLPQRNIVNHESISRYKYLEVFKLLLTNVWQCQQNMHLFDEDDLQKFNLFFNLSEPAKALYVQLLKVKHQWRQVNTLKYDDICPNLLPIVKELVVQDLLESSETLEELSVMLNMLKMPELKSLMQEFQLPTTGRKLTMITTMLDHSRCQRSISNEKNLNKVIVERVKEKLGPCVRLNQEYADAMHRCCLLSSLHTCLSDETFAQLVFRIYRVQKQELNYPQVQLQRCRSIFPNKDAFLRFQKAQQIHQTAQKSVVNKDWDCVMSVTQEALALFSDHMKNATLLEHDINLPRFLRRFTAGSVLVGIMKYGIDALGRRKKYAEIVTVLEQLLSQNTYRIRQRGFWYERLALTLHVHLKNHSKAAEIVLKGMEDSEVHIINKLALVSRATQLLKNTKTWKPPANVLNSLNTVIATQLISDFPKITIRARSRQRLGQGLRLDYIHECANGEEIIVSSVEEFAISYYKNAEAFTEGIHAEGSAVVSLFGIIFWDVIYEKYVPDTFLSPYQNAPLDLYSTEFCEHRQSDIDERLNEVQNWDDNEAINFLQGMWEQHFGKESIVVWRLFSDVTQAQNLLLSIGQFLIGRICHRLCRDFHTTRSGFPDLTLWCPEDKRCKFVEIKGPNDSLSNNQKVWLDFLHKNGADVEVCYVQTVSPKFLG